jgi:oxygen-independent coproporphyrinogen-3 oxidase
LRDRTIETVFFGGGTPTLLPAQALIKVLDDLRSAFTFAQDAEISLEANPESVPDVPEIKLLSRAGFNRVSLGVQSFSDAQLALLGRLHTAEDARDAFERLRKGGLRNISLDLMWALPGQRPQAWLNELKQAVELSPAHLSCYALSLEPGTALANSAAAEKHGSGGIDPLPKEREQSLMYVQGIEYLASQGYIQYEISNMSRMGFSCRHNMGYWTGADYLGLGPSAVSTITGQRLTNSRDHLLWQSAVESGKTCAAPEEIDKATRLLETVMLRLRTSRGLPLDLYQELSGRDFIRDHGPLVRLLASKKLAALRNRHLRLTLPGMLVSNSIIEKLFERLTALNTP